jgi:hypothetical protein
MSVLAQESYIDWQVKPVLHNIKPAYTKESAVILEDQRVHEYRKDEKNELSIYIYYRKLIKVNDDKGVEMYNKIYVYIPTNGEVLEIRARAVQPNGKVVDLPADKILDEEEEGKRYKKFAIEGLEKGSEIEYFVRIKKEISTFGLEVFQSAKTPFEKADFTLIVPEYLVFAVKGYNGFKINNVKIVDKKRIITATEENIEALDDDKYAVTAPYHKNIQYKLSYNLDKDKSVRLYTWNELAKNVYYNYNTFSEKELKAIDNFFKQIKFPEEGEESKIATIEEYIKTNINTDENSIGEDADKIERIVKTKVAGNFGFIRLFIGILQKAGINHQIVFPSKRNSLSIDENFENYRLIDDMLLYFPGTGNFLDPVNASTRYPFVDPYYAGTRGLFLKGTTIGDFKTALASFDTIPLQSFEKSASNIYVKIVFNATMDSLMLHSKQTLLGYSAASYRPAYRFLPKDKQDDFTKDIIKSIANSDLISNIKTENTAMTDGSKNLPLNIIADISTAELIEKAGNKILLKVGEVIGPQVELYQEKKRQLPVLIQYPHVLDREIKFTIPAGYQVKNLQDVNFNVTDKSTEGHESMGFISSYSLNNSELVITIHEFYKSIFYPVSRFEEYRKVVNAAADFNKVVLVLEKK